MDVSVIIVNYNTRQMTAECIDSVLTHTHGVQIEIIVVDNASTDGSRQQFEADTRLTYIYSEQNLGFGKANNLGYQRASGRYVFLLNSDTLLCNNAIAMMCDFMDKPDSSQVGACGALLKNKDGQIIHSYGDLPGLGSLWMQYVMMPILWRLHIYYMPQYRDNPAQRRKGSFEVGYITGADLFIRRQVCEECGLFNPGFFLYFEETEMQHRYDRTGWKRKIIEGPCIVHLEGQSQTRQAQLSRLTTVMRSMMLYLRLTVHPFPLFFYRLAMKLCYIPQIFFMHRPMAEKKAHAKAVMAMR